MGGYYNLKALIKAIRACKTLADERVVIDRESAAIRESFRDEDVFMRHASIEKLLYIFMLGYRAHYGQIECLKLVASPRFADKRLGYLGIMLLLDENTELLTMVTNSLKNDMNHANMYIVGLALCTFANISSEEMSRDLANEVEKLLGSSNVYIRKKAALCAMRIVRKVPDLIDHFVHRATSLLSDRNHGVLLCGVTLVTDMCAADPQVAEGFRKAVPMLVRHLKALVTTGYSPEHDVSGITDPFLQVKILRLLRILGNGDAEASEAMNDILAQVATNTEGAKNVGNSILYEAVLTILDIEAESSLRVLAINILGKFLSNKDNNIRYVALNTLNKVVAIDTNAVQRHRTIILDCLRDGDISIRRRALELSYALINESNVRVLIKELLTFLEVADTEFKLGMTTQICLAAERFAPNKRWHIDTVLRVLKVAGNYVREDVLASFIRLVTHTPELQGYAAQRLFAALKTDLSQDSLTLAGVWTIGEFGDVLLQAGQFEDEESVREVNATEVIDLFDSILLSPYVNGTVRQFAVTSCTKLSTRFPQGPEQQRLLKIVHGFATSPDVEIQQRAIEYNRLLSDVEESVRSAVLERMPPPELKATVIGTVSEKRAVGSTRSDKNALLDLMGDGVVSGTTNAQPAVQQTTRDLLADIFGTDPPAAPAQQKSAVNDIMGLFGDNSNATVESTASPNQPTPAPAPASAPAPTATYTAYEGHGLKVALSPSKDAKAPNVTNFLLTFTATGSDGIQSINFQAAVPRTQKLQMMAISNADIPVGGHATQQMRVMAQPEAQIRLRLRIAFSAGGQARQEQADFSLPM